MIFASSFFAAMALAFIMVFVFWRIPATEPWPDDYALIFTYTIDDSGSDFDQNISGAPAYIDEINYSPINVTKVWLGMDGDYLYMRLDYASTIPDDPLWIAATGNVQEQTVGVQGTSLALDVDSNPDTGAEFSGIEIFFSVNHEYGSRSEAYAKYDLSALVVVKHLDGEVGDGGMGDNYVIVRYDTSQLGEYFPRGDTVMLEFWSEAESDLYHHFDFEEIDAVQWTIPQ
ncbi:MAG: hypothetical protein HN929_12040 [Chloroflexi bacterium]|nr:hypothetical protein [Chloroflexota bacterium]MBT7082170.1 hypothetical protein [Chloroflexota bacterium]